MAYRFSGVSGDNVQFYIDPFIGYTFGALTFAALVKRATAGAAAPTRIIRFIDNATTTRVTFEIESSPADVLGYVSSVGTSRGSTALSSTSVWYLLAVTRAAGAAIPRFHWHNGTSWTHQDGNVSRNDSPIILASDRLFFGSTGAPSFDGDAVCAGVKKANSSDVTVETLLPTSFQSWRDFSFDWLIGFDSSLTVGGLLQDQASPGTGDEIGRSGTTEVAGPPGFFPAAAPTFVPQIIWLTPAASAGATPAAPTYESSIAYASVANRPAATGTTRPFASAAALNGALSAAAPGDLVSYTGAGILDIPGNYVGFAVRRYAGYVNVDLGLASSPNHVRFTGGGGAGLPAVGIYNSQYLRIYGGEITNPPPKSTGHDGLHIYGAGHAHDGSTNHITWWNLVVHDTVDSGIKMLPNVPFGGSGQTAADNTIADCDIEATVYMIGRDKTVDTHPEPGTGQHCCLLADTDPAGATYPSFLRNRVAIDGYNTGLSAGQGGGSIVELGFNDAASTISGCTLIIRGNNTLFNAQQQTAGNGLNLWGDAPIGCAVTFLQHSNATGSAVCNFPPGYNRSGVVVAYGRHTNTNQNAYEGVNPWQIGPTYTNVA